MAKDNELVIKINGNIKNYQEALKKVSAETENLQGVLNSVAATGVVAFAGLGVAIGLSVKQAAKFETIQAQFETLTGSVNEAQKIIKNLSDFAAKTPFQFEGIAQAAKQLLAFKIPAEELPSTLRRIGDVAAATGAEFKDLTLIFGQVKAAGKLTGERLLQLEERAVPIGPALAKTMGVAETAIRDLVSKGEVDFKTFEKAFASLSEKGGLAFEGMEKRSQTLEGRLSTLSDNFQLLQAEIGKEFIPFLKTAAEVLTKFLGLIRENPELTELAIRAAVAGTAIGGLISAAALGATIFLKLRASMVAATLATKGMTFAVKGLVGATGFGLIIAFLPEIIEGVKFTFDAVKSIIIGFSDKIGKIFSALGGLIASWYTLDIAGFKKSFNELKAAFSEAAEDTVSAWRKTESGIEKETNKVKKTLDGVSDSTEKNQKKATEAVIKGGDARIQKLKDENELIKAALAGQTKEQLAFLKKRLEIAQKQRDAEIIQNAERRKLALENIKLLNQQLIKEEKEVADKRIKIQAEKDKKAADRRKKEEESTRKRIQSLKNQNELIEASLDKLENKEIEFIRRRREIKDREIELDGIRNQTERELAAENIKLKYEKLLAEEREYFQRRQEIIAEQAEIEQLLQAELDQLTKDQRTALREADLEELRNGLKTKENLRAEAAKKELLNRRKENKLFADDEKKFGKTFASLKDFFRKEEFKNAQNAAFQLSQLQQSENASLKAIGKAAALVQIAIDTQRGAMAAYAALAGLGPAGPALGAAAAAALIAFGAERAVKVQAAQRGGIVAGAGLGDRIPFLLEPGELITPRRNFEEVVNAVTERRIIEREIRERPIFDEDEERAVNISVGFDSEEAADIITIRQNEQRFSGISQEF